jgi:PAS domain S-box-containing protein
MGERAAKAVEERLTEELHARVRQQAAVAELGQRALAGADLPELMDETVALVAQTLGVNFTEILELFPEREMLLLRAGFGWDQSLIGSAMIKTDAGTHVGAALLTDAPIIVDDLRHETRFKPPPWLLERGVVSCMSVRIEGQDSPFGALCAHTAGQRSFSRDEIHFLQSIAHVLAAAIERKREEAKLVSLNANLQKSLKELTDLKFALDESAIVAITDQRGRITYSNDKFCDIAKYARDELLGQDHRIINSGYHPKEFIRNLWTTIASGKVWRDEICNRAKDGSIYWVDTTIVPFLNSEGQPCRYIAIRYDITERKKLESELQRAAQLSLIGEMAAGLAHEIKNPLAGIQGIVDVLIRRREANNPEREALEKVRREVGRLDQTVRALLERARPRALKTARTSLTEIARRAVSLARHQVSGTRREEINIEFEPDAEPLILPLDTAQIEDAILNLILNAIDAIDGEGRIMVRVHRQRAESQINERDEAVIVVEDSGRGIPERDLPHIFSPFFSKKREGSGLGLAAARRIARAHGGRVEVQSTMGHGSCFTIHLPLKEEEGEAHHAEA